jgi:hypothetical protein
MAEKKGYKKCKTCKEELHYSKFREHKNSADGYRNHCRRCSVAIKKTPEYFAPVDPGPLGKEEKFVAHVEENGIVAPNIVDLDQAHPVLEGIPDEEFRARVKDFLSTILEGKSHKKAMVAGQFSWNVWANTMHKYEGLRDLYLTCKDLGTEFRGIVRLDAAHERAVDGVDDPIYSAAGKFLGNRKMYSDRLLELLLKADNPDKFSTNHKVGIEGTVLQIGLGFNRDDLRQEVAKKDAEDAEFEMVQEKEQD